MKKLCSCITITLLFLSGCDVPKAARDAIAADYGYIVTARDQNVETCRTMPTQQKCVTINRAIDAHAAAQKALNTYCSGPALEGNQSYADGGPCAPARTVEAGLKIAIDNLDAVTASVKEIIR